MTELIQRFPDLVFFQQVCLLLGCVMLVWNTVEVGRNDAANLVNAVFGARVLARRTAVLVAGVAVVAGAVLSSDVIDTARKGIFNPTGLGSLEAALSIYIAVYIVNTVLLNCYSAFGMPVSTTACLVFALLGAAMATQHDTVNWGKAGMVIAGIVCSIVMSGFAAFLIQRAARGAVRDKTTNLSTLLLHGGWLGGGLAAGLSYFLLLKGMKHLVWVGAIRSWMHWVDEKAEIGIAGPALIIFMWGGYAMIIHLMLIIYRRRAAMLLFPVLSVLGMIAMAFAFGQNDLANCASPGVSIYYLIQAGDLELGSKVAVSAWVLFGCGILLFCGMGTKNAARVTKAEVATGSMGDHVALWAPQWCVGMASLLLRFRGKAPALAPRAGFTQAGKTMHYDALRACVIMSVSASVIATASSLKLPVSTTYVAFAAVIATGMADRIFQRGNAELKLGRTIWVVSSWFISAALAAAAAALVTTVVLKFGVAGIAGCLVVNLIVRRALKRRADAQAERVADAADERKHPERFALEDEEA